jgi:small GTP-binding protein
MKGVKDVFTPDTLSTVGFEFLTYSIKLNGQIIKLQIWDTCGQEIYKSLVSSFYRNTSLAFLVYSIDNRNSFNDIDKWLKEIRTYANPDVKLFLIGNKTDLENNREVSQERALKFKDENKMTHFTETSAKTGVNCKDMFVQAAKILYEEYLNMNSNTMRETTFRPYDTNTKLPRIDDDVNGRHTIKIDPSRRTRNVGQKCKC